MCEELSYQIINISAVNQTVFCRSLQKSLKTLALAVARNEEMHFFEFT